MNDRGMKKWQPFNALASRNELLTKPSCDNVPVLSKDEITEFEEILKGAMYTHSKVNISYIEKGSKKTIEDYVENLDPIKKDIILKSKRINFRQIYKVKR